MMTEPVFCFNCKYLKPGWYGRLLGHGYYCDHPENVRIMYTWLKPCRNRIKPPADRNHYNTCDLYVSNKKD